MKRKKNCPIHTARATNIQNEIQTEDKMFARATKQGYSQGHKIGYKHKTQSRRHNFCTHSPRFCMRPTTNNPCAGMQKSNTNSTHNGLVCKNQLLLQNRERIADSLGSASTGSNLWTFEKTFWLFSPKVDREPLQIVSYLWVHRPEIISQELKRTFPHSFSQKSAPQSSSPCDRSLWHRQTT